MYGYGGQNFPPGIRHPQQSLLYHAHRPCRLSTPIHPCHLVTSKFSPSTAASLDAMSCAHRIWCAPPVLGGGHVSPLILTVAESQRVRHLRRTHFVPRPPPHPSLYLCICPCPCLLSLSLSLCASVCLCLSRLSHRLGVHLPRNLSHSGSGKAILEVRLHLIPGNSRVRAGDAAALICRYPVASAEEGVGHFPCTVQAVTQSDLSNRAGRRTEKREGRVCATTTSGTRQIPVSVGLEIGSTIFAGLEFFRWAQVADLWSLRSKDKNTK